MKNDWQRKYLNKITQGNCLELMKELPCESIDCVITSPPYWGLRSYKGEPLIWGGRKDCQHEMLTDSDFCTKCGAWRGSLGLEPTFELYIQHLCDIFDEVKRVLKGSGTCWVNIDDTYAGNGLPSKCLSGIPERFMLEMIDNRGWILRNTIIWHKPNCMPESARDRFTVDHEYLYFFVKNKKYYFEQQFEPVKQCSIERLGRAVSNQNKWVNGAGGQTRQGISQPRPNIKYRPYKGGGVKGRENNCAISTYTFDGGDYLVVPFDVDKGRNKRTTWTITTKGYRGMHFATFPETLVITPIKAGCPEFVCKSCGKPKEKIYGTHNPKGITGRAGKSMVINGIVDTYDGKQRIEPGHNSTVYSSAKFKGWKVCKCNAGFESGIVLDPFVGSGTTALACIRLNRNFIGFELNPDDVVMANKRLVKYTRQGRILLKIS